MRLQLKQGMKLWSSTASFLFCILQGKGLQLQLQSAQLRLYGLP